MTSRRDLTLAAIAAILTFPSAAAADDAAERLERFWRSAYDGAARAAQPLVPDVPGTWARQRLAKAAPDECFDGIGQPYPQLEFAADGAAMCVDPGTGAPRGVPKVNAAYVWGLVQAGGKLWFGTGPNIHCLVMGAILPLPHQTPSWVCEFGESPLSPPFPEGVGDWRPPKFFRYDPETRDLEDVTPADFTAYLTLGIRSAGHAGGIVFLGGPALLGGVNLFAFDSNTGRYIGSRNLAEYSDIRRWVNVGGVLYTGVGKKDDGGSVLRWTGNRFDPFRFAVVGEVDAEAAELAEHEGRMFVATWPQIVGAELGAPASEASLWMSPLIGEAGLEAADAGSWRKVWTVSDYEPDQVTALTYGGGALESFDGYLYWGTMHVPILSAAAHVLAYGEPETVSDVAAVVLGTHRAISLFRGRDLAADQPLVELVYGEAQLPAFVPGAEGGTWELRPTGMGAPIWGPSGFGNPFNNYTWEMTIARRQLFVGTMDWSYLVAEGLETLLPALGGAALDPGVAEAIAAYLQFAPANFGADLLRIDSSRSPGEFESMAGVGNYTSYGVRTMIGTGRELFVGMANPMNLLTDPTDDIPEGGWELLALEAPPMCASRPMAGCLSPTYAKLVVQDAAAGLRDKISWRWASRETIAPADVGDPTTGNDYHLCLYDESTGQSALAFQALAPAGGTCGGASCWKALRTPGSFKFSDGEGKPHGLVKLKIKPGASGKSKVLVEGKGENLSAAPLGMTRLPLGFPLRVQLQAGNGVCWEALYGPGWVGRNDAGRFVGKTSAPSGAGGPY